MKNKALQMLAMLLAACPAVGWAQAPKDGVYISDEDVKAVLKYAVDTKRTIVDNTIRVIDMNKYQLGVAVIHRGANDCNFKFRFFVRIRGLCQRHAGQYNRYCQAAPH